MNITNVKLKTALPGYECWNYQLDGEKYAYTTMAEEKFVIPSFTSICYARDLYGSKRIALIYEYLPLNANNPKAGIERFYKLTLLQ
jgi:hypothetical protein